ncbi:MAG: hypothetical protein WC870_00025 [Candidatus Paceibacterota bacterium]
MKGLDKKPQQTTKLPLERRPFEEYSGDERMTLAMGIRTKKLDDLSNEEKEYKKWLESSEVNGNDSQPNYYHE